MFVHSITIVKFGERERERERKRVRAIAKENLYAEKRPIRVWNVYVNNIVISKLVKAKTNSKHLI